MLFRVSPLKSLIHLAQSRKISYGQLKSWYSGLVKKPPPIPPYSHIIQIGDPVLRVVADNVPNDLIKSSEIQFLIKIMKGVFKRYDCVGLSAPQIGISLRVFITEFNANHLKAFDEAERKTKEMKIFPQTVVINPQLKVTDYTKVIYTEACESVKGYWADVPRYRAVELNGYNENGEKISINAKGWLARIFQHELDHLDGKLYTDSMDRKTLTCTCWQVVNERSGKVEIPFNR
ncbi:hypothetical protein ILUMI_26737 [Ignelater luminosus]|uniref:Peptide deformylase n=1 Tax=Ignelater luminosus TaxID=2038154 RepID=A0A8K0C612_IGNLU|nr:hypothetical protein ILUMI_26737 [Ignelater luminosus]